MFYSTSKYIAAPADTAIADAPLAIPKPAKAPIASAAATTSIQSFLDSFLSSSFFFLFAFFIIKPLFSFSKDGLESVNILILYQDSTFSEVDQYSIEPYKTPKTFSKISISFSETQSFS